MRKQGHYITPSDGRRTSLTVTEKTMSVVILLLLLVNMFFSPQVVSGAEKAVPENESYQVIDKGGTTTSSDEMASISKTLKGTDYENVFDITLTVKTKENIEKLYAALDTDIVIVSDISYSMLTALSDGATRYDASLAAIDHFLDLYQKTAITSTASCRVGYVAFNTSAHNLLGLTECKTASQKKTIYQKIKSGSDAIMHGSGYSSSVSRFTNIEAGMKMARDMLAKSNAPNKYVIFLSDGFPTTYIKSGYEGYNPYMNSSQNPNYASQTAGGIGSDGYFYNQKAKIACTWGTSYSDKGATKAQNMAAEVKKNAKVYSIGIGLKDQSIASMTNYVVDCYGKNYNYGTAGYNYVIGNDTAGFKLWLRDKIASNKYWDSTDSNGLEEAYKAIFDDILVTNEETIKDIWIATDPMSAVAPSNVEFLHFYDMAGKKVDGDLINTRTPATENTARIVVNDDVKSISWDLKNSVCEVEGSDTEKIYSYELRYRVRLDTSATTFTPGKEYATNGRTFLTYQISTDGKLGDPEILDFKVPVVKGYRGGFSFEKKDSKSKTNLAGAEFTLVHSTDCECCNVIPELEDIEDSIAISGIDGKVTFAEVPSGHDYILKESKPPKGYEGTDAAYNVRVSYGSVMADLPESSSGPHVIYNTKKNIKITKKIDADDINFVNGDPTFIFKFEEVAEDGKIKEYYRSVTFTKEYVKEHEGTDGKVTMTIVLDDIDDQMYVVKEVDTYRFELDKIEAVKNGTVKGDTVSFDMKENTSAEATFCNDVKKFDKLSHTDIVINTLDR